MDRGLLPLLLLLLLTLIPANAAEFTRTEDVIYGRKHGVALTLDVFKPAAPNGYGVIMVISGGFFSSHEAINAGLFRPTLDRGYTVFAVVHGSQPKYTIPEIVEDMHRAVRFIRHHAAEYGVKPDRLGVMGASAGGHLSLTLAVHGGPGKSDAKDPVDRESSAVAAVACFFPPTDLLNYGQPGEDAVGVGTLKDFKPAFGPRSDTPEGRQSLGREISPIYYVTSNLPPTLILHGDADRLVPLQQAESFVAKAKAAGATVRLDVKPGAGHGWPSIAEDLPTLADWFDTHLRGIPAKNAAAP
ncbi:MAG TPA: alpha/beta hydrolase [Verrucomicrobiota bacterium]|nr:alpha/beta hydrolase [Verrucomicrobiota bacterium]